MKMNMLNHILKK